jgi:hypothetical protein
MDNTPDLSSAVFFYLKAHHTDEDNQARSNMEYLGRHNEVHKKPHDKHNYYHREEGMDILQNKYSFHIPTIHLQKAKLMVKVNHNNPILYDEVPSGPHTASQHSQDY